MKIALAGTAGTLATELATALEKRGADLLFAGNDVDTLRQHLPGRKICGLGELAKEIAGFDLLVDFGSFPQVLPGQGNQYTQQGRFDEVMAAGRKAGVSQLVHVTPLRFDKRSAPSSAPGIDIVSLAIPTVYSDRPGNVFSRMIKTCKAALFPRLNVNRLAEFILQQAPGMKGGSVAIADGQADNRVYGLVKRLIDLAFAGVIVICFWWLLAIVWVLIRLQSPGPGVFAQQRVGQGGRLFTCYKFRTMYQGTAEKPTNEVPLSHVTRLGHFLRRSKLDELPQVWNILRNEFSLIGPRPCLPSQAELIEARARRGVLALQPGISGLSQVKGIEMSDPERLAISDARYLALQSLQIDARIMFETVAVVFRSLK